MVAMAAAECRHMVAAADRQAVPAASKKNVFPKLFSALSDVQLKDL
jgi:hypothetical protein